MRLDRLKPETQRALAAGVSAAALLFAALQVGPRMAGIWTVRRQVEALQKQITLRERQNQAERAAESRQPLPAPPESREEPLAYLRELSRVVAVSRVKLISYRPPDPEAAHQPSETSALLAEGPSRVKPIATEVSVAGSFGSLVALFRALASRERLYTVEGLEVRTDTYPRLTATFRLVRYVLPPGALPGEARGALMRMASAAAGE